jgi:hypothetical protein
LTANLFRPRRNYQLLSLWSSGIVVICPPVDNEQIILCGAERIIGNGSFGVVLEAKVVETNKVVAIKKVQKDKRFKN